MEFDQIALCYVDKSAGSSNNYMIGALTQHDMISEAYMEKEYLLRFQNANTAINLSDPLHITLGLTP